MSEESILYRLSETGATETADQLKKVSRATRGIGEDALLSGRESSRSMSLMTEGFKGIAGMVGITGAAFGIKDLAEAGMNLQHQQTQLKLATEGTAGAYERLDAAAVKSSEHGGFSRDEELQSMTQLMAATGSQTETLRANTAAVALARHEGLSYASAQHYMDQAVVGNVNRLKQYTGYINPVKTAEYELGQAHKVNIIQLEAEAKAMGKSGPAWLKQAELVAGITPVMHNAAVEQDKLATGRVALNKILSNPAFSGAQGAYDKTLQGKVTDLKQTFQEVAGSIGEMLIPAMTEVVGVAMKIVDVMNKNKWIAVGLALAIAALGTIAFGRMLYGGVMRALSPIAEAYKWITNLKKGSEEASVATEGLGTSEEAAAVQGTLFAGGVEEATGQLTLLEATSGEAAGELIALGAAEDVAAGGFSLMAVAAGILEAIPMVALFVAIGIAIYELVTHFKQVKAAALDAWKWIESAAGTAWNFIKSHWVLIGTIIAGPLGFAVAEIATHFKSITHWGVNAFDNIEHAASVAIAWIKNAWHNMTNFINKDTPLGIFGQLAGGHLGGALHAATFGLLSGGGRVSAHDTASEPRSRTKYLYSGGPVGTGTKYLYSGGPVGTDTVPGMLTPGEGILDRAAMQQVGDRGLSLLNSGAGLGSLGGGGEQITITPSMANFYVDGRVLARALVRYTLEKAARGPSSLVGGSLVTGV